MPDLIRDPETIEKMDSGLRRYDGKSTLGTLYEFVKSVSQRHLSEKCLDCVSTDVPTGKDNLHKMLFYR